MVKRTREMENRREEKKEREERRGRGRPAIAAATGGPRMRWFAGEDKLERKREREGGKEREGRQWLLRTEEGPQKALALCLVETRESRPCFNQTQGEGHPRASPVLWRPPPAKANSPSPSLPLFSSLQFALFRTPPSSTALRWPPLWPASISFSLPPLSLFSFLQFSLALQGPSRPSDGHHRLSSPSPPSLSLPHSNSPSPLHHRHPRPSSSHNALCPPPTASDDVPNLSRSFPPPLSLFLSFLLPPLLAGFLFRMSELSRLTASTVQHAPNCPVRGGSAKECRPLGGMITMHHTRTLGVAFSCPN